MSSTFLQLLLLLNVFLIGALSAVAIRHAYAHFRPSHHEDKPHTPAPTAHLPPAVREQLLHAAKANFQVVLERSASQLQHDLDSTATQLNKHLEKLGTKIIEDETERYHTTLELLRKQAETTIDSAQSDVSHHQTEIQQHLTEYQAKLEAELSEKMNAEHERLIQQIDTKLADAVTSFLLETLQHNVDLGTQGAYLTAMLEEHKDELAKGMKNDA
jgi:F0F1-type ATP synthase membrane subunit b/b'